MIKTPTRDGSVVVTFELPAAVTAESVTLCGDFNDWSETSHPLNRTDNGFKASVELAPGQRWRFRYLLDGARWENDWAADDYIGNEFGGEDSIVDLTDVDLTDTATLVAPESPAADADKASGTRRRKATADAPPATAPTRSTPAASAAGSEASKPAGTANGKPKRAAATASAADAAPAKPATQRAARKPAAPAADGAEKKPATSRRKPAASRQSGKDT